MGISRVLLSIASAVLLTSCGGSGLPRPDTSNSEVTLSVRPFFKDMFDERGESTGEVIARLEHDYPDFFVPFSVRELRIGKPGSADFESNFERFVAYKENSEVLPVCDSVWRSLDVNAELSDAFSCFAALFPQQPVPEHVYCHFSGFNSKVTLDSTFISFAIEHYLGPDCPFYDMLDMPLYARRSRDSRFVVSDLVRAWIYSCMPDLSDKDDVLSALVYQGKVSYVVRHCVQGLSEADLLCFSDDQLRWCKTNEAKMWACLAENKLLYSTNMLDKTKLVNEAPFTYFFGNSSPGRASLYCAYRMVCEFMNAHPEVTDEDLMKMDNAQDVLVGASYNPR